MDPKHYYKILGVPHDATQKQINHAYRELAKKWHPDINHAPNAGKMFTKINQAYSVLGNKKKRAAYDQFGSSDATGFGGAGNGANFNGFGGFNPGGSSGFGDFGGFSDIFNDFFGGFGNHTRTQQRNQPKQGADMSYRMHISFAQAAFGGQTTVSYDRQAVCPHCHGSGAEPGSNPKTCPTCHGTGEIIRSIRTAFGTTQLKQTCPTCHGSGRLVTDKCSMCHGSGHVVQSHELEIDIPAGINDGQRMRLNGQGEAGKNGGSYGDLYIIFSVEPSKNFTRKGNNIYVDKDISIPQATLGGTVNVKALNHQNKSEDGAVELKIPAGTSSGTTFRLNGLGIPGSSGIRGDEEVKVHIAVPKHLNRQQKEALVEFARASGDRHNGLFRRMKNAFNR